MICTGLHLLLIIFFNRSMSLIMRCALLYVANRLANPMVKARDFKVPQYPHYFAWVDDPSSQLSNDGLKQAIENVRPEGERRFTAEWILYNILDLKFMEGRKVRKIAMRLAVSEADLYRKQRVAIEEVANAIVEMEQQARLEVPSDDEIKNQQMQKTIRGGFNGK